MVTIQCPHCEKDIELEDGLVGLFDCPYCARAILMGTAPLKPIP